MKKNGATKQGRLCLISILCILAARRSMRATGVNAALCCWESEARIAQLMARSRRILRWSSHTLRKSTRRQRWMRRITASMRLRSVGASGILPLAKTWMTIGVRIAEIHIHDKHHQRAGPASLPDYEEQALVH